MSTDISKCNSIKIGETNIFDIETEILKSQPDGIKRTGDSEIRTYKSGYFVAKVTYKDNIVTDYECNKE